MAEKRQNSLETMQAVLANFDDTIEAEKNLDDFYIDRYGKSLYPGKDGG